MSIPEGELEVFKKQFENMIQTLEGMDGLTILGFACTVITAETGLGLIFGGDVTIRSTAIDLLSSHHHANVVGQDEMSDLIEEAMAKVN